MRYVKYILFPFSICYWLFTYVRNVCFNIGILHQEEFQVPLISVGNITVGGTGKTPHVQYIINLLQGKNIASLSRGYKRKTTGFVLSDETTSVADLGDEPFLLQKRFPDLHVAVCEKRVVGVNELLSQFPDLQGIILDDAFQHRYVKPQLQIVLIDYNRPLWKDCVFPVGYLREGKYALKRADIVVVTKCPESFSETDKRFWLKKLKIDESKLFFSQMEYGSVYQNSTKQPFENTNFFAGKSICLITGIAQPKPLVDYLKQFNVDLIHKSFPDHYSYSEMDKFALEELSKNHTIVTTEKDIYKLAEILPDSELFVIPIQPKFLFGKENQFNEMILNAVN